MGPVDLYIGGAEHATLHLLYSRFWYLALFDLGVIATEEPFTKLVNQGMLGSFAYEDARGVLYPVDEVDETSPDVFVHKPSGETVKRIEAKMSKTLRNVVNPDDVVAEYGSDAFRIHLMFMGPVEGGRVWDTAAVISMLKFLRRVWALVTGNKESGIRETVSPDTEPTDVKVAVNTLITNITEDMEKLRLNTAVAELMKFVNAAEGNGLSRGTVESFIKVLSPMAPHLAEELWQRAGHAKSIAHAPWPVADQAVLDAANANVEVVLQILGKKRGVITVASAVPDDVLTEAAMVYAGTVAKQHMPANPKVLVVRDKATGKPRLVNVVKG